MTVSERADELLQRLLGNLGRLVPAATTLIDAHTHLGLDEDGMRLDLGTLTDEMRRHDIAHALVFPLHEPDRHPAYRAPNDRVLAWAAQSDGMLWPLARLDLAEDPIHEAERCLDRGAMGIKLHPRAQRFDVDDNRLEPVFDVAAERQVPVLIHAGRGMPPIGAQLARVAERHPRAVMILAHAAIIDQKQICDRVAGMPNVVFDTSTWSPFDLLALLQRVPARQVVFASDAPYGSFLPALALIASLLDELDADDDTRRAVFGGTIRRIVDRSEVPPLGVPLAPSSWPMAPVAGRLQGYLAAATPQIWFGEPDRVGYGGLAVTVASELPDELDVARELIELGVALWSDGLEGFADRRRVYRLFALAQIATAAPRAAARLYA